MLCLRSSVEELVDETAAEREAESAVMLRQLEDSIRACIEIWSVLPVRSSHQDCENVLLVRL